MFAGIIEKVGRVVGVRETRTPTGERALRLELELAGLLDGLQLGASVAVNGACLTLAEQRPPIGGFDVIPETWQATTLSDLRAGAAVNLERALRVGDRIDGHFVQGHVDGVGTVDSLEQRGGEFKLWVRAPEELSPYIVRKGSIAIDGVSLTVVDVEPPRFSVALIPTTLNDTVLRDRQAGSRVNLETDILARIVVARLGALLPGAEHGTSPAPAGVSWEQLREGGFAS